MKVAVLGAAGWLGRAVLTHLEEHGHQVRAIDYGPEAWKAWEDVDGTYGGEIIHADISDYDQMVSALEGQEAIVHTLPCTSVLQTLRRHESMTALSSST